MPLLDPIMLIAPHPVMQIEHRILTLTSYLFPLTYISIRQIHSARHVIDRVKHHGSYLRLHVRFLRACRQCHNGQCQNKKLFHINVLYLHRSQVLVKCWSSAMQVLFTQCSFLPFLETTPKAALKLPLMYCYYAYAVILFAHTCERFSR